MNKKKFVSHYYPLFYRQSGRYTISARFTSKRKILIPVLYTFGMYNITSYLLKHKQFKKNKILIKKKPTLFGSVH